MKSYRSILMSALMCLASTPAFAQAKAPTAQKVKTLNACAADKLAFGSGTPRGTYGQMSASLAAMCSMICEVQETQGGYDNITQMVNEKFDSGIVQADLIEFLNRTEPDIRKKLRSLFALHGSSMHMFVSLKGVPVAGVKKEPVPIWKGGGTKDVPTMTMVVVEKLSDLKGKRIAAWSSAYVTANIVSERLKLDWDVVEVKTRGDGLKMVQDGQAWMFMAAGGKPVEWIDEVKADQLTMLNLDPGDIAKIGAPYYPVKVTYRNLKVNGWNTITVRNEVLVRNITTGPLAALIPAFKKCMVDNLDAIKSQRDKHASWSDVEDLGATTWLPYAGAVSAASTTRVKKK
jgi:TRAP-type uncharacterized transport system substrate-binding protein